MVASQLRQSKTGAAIVIPVAAPLRVLLEVTPRVSTIIVVNSLGHPWTSDGFGHACRKAGVVGLTFHDLRGSCVTRLALAGSTVPESCAITGQRLRDAGRILEAHYLHRDPRLAEAAIAKLEENVRRTKL